MKIEHFEDIHSWVKAKELTLELYKAFANEKEYFFKDQILRASVSIMNNIAEGFGRNSRKEFKHFLYIANGSNYEVKSMLYLALELKKINKEKCSELISLNVEISKLLKGFIKILN